MTVYAILVMTVIICSFAQLLLKTSAKSEHHSAISTIINWKVMMAYSIMFISLFINTFVMKYGVGLKDIPIIGALGYIVVPIISWLFLDEKIDKYRVISIFFVLIGILLFYV